MNLVDSIVKQILHKAKISKKTKLSNASYHIEIASKSIGNINFIPGYFLRLGVGVGKSDFSIKDKIRSYSVWNIDKKNNTIDLVIATQSKGIGANWVKNCKIGDELYFTWKKGNFILDNSADSYLMIGDLSALSHLYNIRRSLDDNKKVESIIYGQNSNELFADIDKKTPFNFYELNENPHQEIQNEIEKIMPQMSGKKMVYIAGDSRICVFLTNYFKKELKWNSKQIKTKPFWNPDKKGLE